MGSPQRHALIALLLTALASNSRAHLPEIFGREYTLAAAAPGHAPTETPTLQATAGDPELLQQQLAQRQREGGAYGATLTEPLVSLGYFYLDHRKLEAAREAFQRALHLSRINDGLLDEQQLPMLRGLIAVYRESGDFEALAGAYRYYARVGKIEELPATEADLQFKLEWMNWQWEAYARREDPLAISHLLEAYEASAALVAAIAARAQADPQWYREAGFCQLKNLYLILGARPAQARWASMTSHSGASAEIMLRRLAYLQDMGVGIGRRLLQAMIDRSPDLPPAELAALYTELGDWLLWNEAHQRAGKAYKQAIDLLVDAGQDHLVDAWFAEPKELPDARHGLLQPPPRDGNSPVLEAHYRVSARGDVRDLTVNGAAEGAEKQASRVRRLLRDTHFRPRYSSGEAEASSDLVRYYVVLGD